MKKFSWFINPIINEKKPVTDKIIKFDKSEYAVIENKSLVKDKKQIEKNIDLNEFELIDARSEKRFTLNLLGLSIANYLTN